MSDWCGMWLICNKIITQKKVCQNRNVWLFFFYRCHLFFPDHYKINMIQFLPTGGDNQGSQVQCLIPLWKPASLQGEGENVIWTQKVEDPDSQTWWRIKLNLKFHTHKKIFFWASLVAQWLRIHLSMQGTQVRSLVREDPTCRGAAKPMRHNSWACALEPVL